jgi:hypothetical protein
MYCFEDGFYTPAEYGRINQFLMLGNVWVHCTFKAILIQDLHIFSCAYPLFAATEQQNICRKKLATHHSQRNYMWLYDKN